MPLNNLCLLIVWMRFDGSFSKVSLRKKIMSSGKDLLMSGVSFFILLISEW